MEISTVMTTEKIGTGGGTERKSRIGRETKKDTEIRRKTG